MTNPKDDAAADLLIREVDEDLRQENLEKLWKKYGSLFIAGAVAIVLMVAAVQGWRTWQHNRAVHASQRFNEALQTLDRGDKTKGTQQLEALVAEGSAGYRLLSEMKLAQLKLGAGDEAGAIALYEQIAASGADDLYRDLATLKAAYLKIEGGDAAQIEKSVTPLTVETSPWRHSAREVLAILALKQGDQDKAKEWLRKIADDIAAPSGIRGRAAELLAALESAAKG